MINIVSNNILGYTFSIGQDNNEVIDDLANLFVERYGPEAYALPKIIIVTSEKFFHVLKNAYHLPLPYGLTEELGDYILQYIDLWKTNIFKESIMNMQGF